MLPLPFSSQFMSKTVPSFFVLSLLVALLSCAGGSDEGDDAGSDGDADASTGNRPDSGTTDEPDAAPEQASPMGQPCEADALGEQGDCPDGFVCLTLQTGAWCSKPCGTADNPQDGDHASCMDGYDGPGTPMCLLGTNANDNLYCSVVCLDEVGGADYCQGGTCNGTCPYQLTCEAENMDGSATLCQ